MPKQRKRRKLSARVRAEIYKDAKRGPKDVDGLYAAMRICEEYGYRTALNQAEPPNDIEDKARLQLTPAMYLVSVRKGRKRAFDESTETQSLDTQDPPDWSA